MELIPLGCNGFIPTFGRQTMSFLLLVDGGRRAVLLDAGTGVARLLESEVKPRMKRVEELTVVLTHYHLDHVVGLSYLPAVWRNRAVTVVAPESPLVDSSPERALARLIGPPLFPIELADLPVNVTLQPYSSSSFEVAGLAFALRRQRHDGGSVGMVIDGRLAYLTDCEMELEATTELASGVDLVIHDTWVTESEVAAGASRTGHSTLEEVAELADRTGARRLLPAHHLPTRGPRELALLLDILSQQTAAEVVEPAEALPIEL